MELSLSKKGKFVPQRSNVLNLIINILLGIIVSCYFFPFGFTFLPNSINTKIILAVVGILFFVYRSVQNQSIKIGGEFIYVFILVIVFSLFGYISADINVSSDYTYAKYWISFSTWLLGAFATIEILRLWHGKVSFEILFNYLIALSVIQCFLALYIDNNPDFKLLIDTYFSQSTIADVEFLNDVKRLYGLGVAVDVAGTRFSIVLLGLVAILRREIRRPNNVRKILLYWFSFIVLAIIGNMISRTTTVGVILSLGYLIFTPNLLGFQVSNTNLKNTLIVLITTIVLIFITVYLYQSNVEIKEDLRFGFEGFFNWFEKGTWTTSSTERLNTVMWIWPDKNDFQTWIIGKATFDNWYAVGTDIGYCRFIFYSGLLGLFTFSLFFVINALICIRKFPQFKLFFVFLLALTFIIWLKVSTDLFLIYALFYFIDNDQIKSLSRPKSL